MHIHFDHFDCRSSVTTIPVDQEIRLNVEGDSIIGISMSVEEAQELTVALQGAIEEGVKWKTT
jgi:hypothetical protein